MLSKKMDKYAKAAGLKKLKLDDDVRSELERMTKLDPTLKKSISHKTAYAVGKSGFQLQSVLLAADKPEPLVVLVNPAAKNCRVSLVQRDQDGEIVGGFTMRTRRES